MIEIDEVEKRVLLSHKILTVLTRMETPLDGAEVCLQIVGSEIATLETMVYKAPEKRETLFTLFGRYLALQRSLKCKTH